MRAEDATKVMLPDRCVQAPQKDSPEFQALYAAGALEGQIDAQRVLALRCLPHFTALLMPVSTCPTHYTVAWTLTPYCGLGLSLHSLARLMKSCELCLCRRAYQRAVSVPTPALEQLWSSYERFEQSGFNKSLGRYIGFP